MSAEDLIEGRVAWTDELRVHTPQDRHESLDDAASISAMGVYMKLITNSKGGEPAAELEILVRQLWDEGELVGDIVRQLSGQYEPAAIRAAIRKMALR